MSDIFDDACYQIFANPKQDVSLWIYKSYVSDLMLFLKIEISYLQQICQTVKEKNFEGGGGHYTHLGTKSVSMIEIKMLT